MLLPTVAAWRAWMSNDRLSVNGSRKALFVAGLVGASVSHTLYVAFATYAYQIGGFGTDFAAMLRWGFSALYSSIVIRHSSILT
jgi:hypothetical protein